MKEKETDEEAFGFLASDILKEISREEVVWEFETLRAVKESTTARLLFRTMAGAPAKERERALPEKEITAGSVLEEAVWRTRVELEALGAGEETVWDWLKIQDNFLSMNSRLARISDEEVRAFWEVMTLPAERRESPKKMAMRPE